jgi:hypothetical protein
VRCRLYICLCFCCLPLPHLFIMGIIGENLVQSRVVRAAVEVLTDAQTNTNTHTHTYPHRQPLSFTLVGSLHPQLWLRPSPRQAAHRAVGCQGFGLWGRDLLYQQPLRLTTYLSTDLTIKNTVYSILSSYFLAWSDCLKICMYFWKSKQKFGFGRSKIINQAPVVNFE